MISPVIFEAGPLAIRWYGVLSALGLLAGYQMLARRARRYGYTVEQVSDITFVCMVAALIGARIAYVIRFWPSEFAGQGLVAPFRVWQGGLVFQGGFILAAVAGVVLCWRRRWSIPGAADLMAAALPLAHGIGRIGCLINGCCFGFAWNGPLAVHYPEGLNSVRHIQEAQGLLEPGAAATLGTFPIAAVESLLNLGLCGLILWLERRQILNGRRFLVYVMAYSTQRFLTEFARGDYLVRPAGLTPAQITSLWVLALTVGITIVLQRRQKRVRPGQAT